MSKDLLFILPKEAQSLMIDSKKIGSSYRIVDGEVMGRSQSIWFTNLDHGKRHEELWLDTMEHNLKYNKKLKKKFENEYGEIKYPRYDNYDALEVPFTECIPSDYSGVMGVPITFLDKFNPEQFEVLDANDYRIGQNGKAVSRDTAGVAHHITCCGENVYRRILIRKKAEK